MSAESSGPSDSDLPKIRYRKLRSPAAHGETLQLPPLEDATKVWKQNIGLLENASRQNAVIGGVELFELQKTARTELLIAARTYDQRYQLAANRPPESSSSQNFPPPIVMSGHQPELFHPGVWYKNFVLSRLGKTVGATAINLVVDNDIMGSASIGFPKPFERSHSTASQSVGFTTGAIAFDRSFSNLPFEVSNIKDLQFFEEFPARVQKAFGGKENRLVHRLWPHVMAAAKSFEVDGEVNLGQAIAGGRHRLEREFGLETLELPISHVAKTKSFAMFVQGIVANIQQFHSAYNEVLNEYRDVHRIRSNSHPVPELQVQNGWLETPFWIWNQSNKRRRGLFVKVESLGQSNLVQSNSWQLNSRFSFSDLDGWVETFEGSDFVDSFLRIQSSVSIRPRALMTTMFSRLILSDMFLHGIGGSKYDQLTDVIAARFFGVELPEYLTISATMKLPTDYEVVDRQDLVTVKQLIRETKYHPETRVVSSNADVESLIRQKRKWVAKLDRSKARHDAIETLNKSLAELAVPSLDELETRRSVIEERLRTSEVLTSREYSFCLFPESLVAELKALAE
jgi:hypothetical protein